MKSWRSDEEGTESMESRVENGNTDTSIK